MANPLHNSGEDESATWGTWDELLLACAVKRHGFKAWDAVASEVQSRTSLPFSLTTPRHCQLKYQDLQRRFSPDDNPDKDPVVTPSLSGDKDKVPAIPWLEELRKLRVAELRQEVHRYDVSILSLQLKVKKLEEEREEGFREDQQQPDLPEESKPGRSDNDKLAAKGETVASLPEKIAAKSAAGDESDRENRSVNGSNSTGLKSEHEKPGREAEPKREEEDGEAPVRARTGLEKTTQVSEESKPEGVDSYNGSSEPNRERRGDESELRDTVGQSKENSSDVQSSASLTRKKKRKGRRVNEISGGEVPEADEGSPAVHLAGAKSQPLLDTLKTIRAHKHGSFFERQHAIQERDKYHDLIRQHLDIETIQSRLRKGAYSSSPLAFYRDLLLLFDNALVFYPKSSPESAAALELHRFVSAELLKKKTPQRSSSTQEPEPVHLRPKPELERSDSLLAKHKSSAPIIVCRKRSSFSAKPSPTTMGQKGAEPQGEDKKRPSSDDPKQQQSKAGQEQENLMKINNAVERSVTGARSLRRSNTNLKSSTTSTSTAPTTAKKPPVGSTEKAETPRADQKKSEGGPAASTKKRSAADFLKRIKRNSPAAGKSKNNTVGVDSKNSKGGAGAGGSGDQKKKQNGKEDKGEERAPRQSGGNAGIKHNSKEDSSPSKRSVGRPPKKGGGESNVVALKRSRDSSAGKEVVSVAVKQRPQKRTRR